MTGEKRDEADEAADAIGVREVGSPVLRADVRESEKGWTTMANVLIVEDDVALRDTVRDLLAAQHHDVAVVGKGIQALEILRATRARTVVLLDVRLPDSTGLDVVRRVVADPSITVPLAFVFMTAYPQMVSPLTGAEAAHLLSVQIGRAHV